MVLERIISMADSRVRLQFIAMQRSLRATGCTLPIEVIPYSDDLFKLPEGCTWWVNPKIAEWIKAEKAHPTMCKYQCLTVSRYHFTDTDVIFLRNPQEALQEQNGFVTSCTEWNKPEWTYTIESRLLFSRRTSTWQQKVFSTGQFACDQTLYSADDLMKTAQQLAFVETCLRFPIHEQPGLNLLVMETGVPITNLTLPPYRMESSWAGDYPGEYEPFWQDPERKPYLIHWAGPTLEWSLPINQIFYNFLTREEKSEWDEQMRQKIQRRNQQYERSLSLARRIARRVLKRNRA